MALAYGAKWAGSRQKRRRMRCIPTRGLLKSSYMLADEQQALDEISTLLAKEREALRQGSTEFSPQSRGRALPLWLNVGTLVALVVLGTALWYWYSAAQESYVLKSAKAGPPGADIVSALLAEAQNTLAAKNKEVDSIQNELKDIDGQLSRLGLGDIIARKKLTDRKAALEGNLAKAIQERDALTRQVAYQAKNLQAAQGGAVVALDPLADLKAQEELRKVFEQNQRSSWKLISSAMDHREWSVALAEVERAQALASAYEPKAADTDRPAVQAQQGLLTSVEGLINAVKAGTPLAAADDSEKLVALVKQQANQLTTLTDQTAQDKKQIDALQKVGEESAIQLDTILKSLNTTVGTSVANAPVTAETLPVRLKELQQVASKVQDYQTLVKKQATELEALRSAPTGTAQMDAALGSFNRLLGTYAPEETGSLTVENFSQKVDALQKKLSQGQDSQALLQQQAALLAQTQAKAKDLQAERDKLAQQVAAYLAAGKEYQVKTEPYAKAAMNLDREALHGSFQAVTALFKDNPTLAAQFPDYSVFLSTLVENLIDVEVARTKAMAEDQLLNAMAATSDKIADERVRMAALSNNANQDATAVFTSLIKEIDTVTANTLKDRTGKVLPRALGSVLSVSRPNVTVRKVAKFEVFQVKRVFLSRILPSGDRIPIAEAEIVATSGDDLLLRITSTIAPTIYPERNDLVFVEL